MKRANQIRGLVAKRAGRGFETNFIATARIQGCEVTRIDQGCEVLSYEGAWPRVLLKKSPYDLCLHREGRSAFIDLKSVDGTRFSYSMIDQSQVKSLKAASVGGPAGYIVKFTTGIAFFPVEFLESIQPKHGFDVNDGIILGNENWYDVRRVF